jgi:nicotinamidase-related amidase
MSETDRLPGSPDLMSAEDTALLVLDAQQKLVPLIGNHARVVWNIRRLLDGAALFGVRTTASEQYPQGLGGTVEPLATALAAAGADSIPSKLTFSCGGCAEIVRSLEQWGVDCVLVVGIETHVCVQQTVLDLMAAGYRIYVAVDAVGSRHAIDYETALRRMDSAGAVLTTTESALCEWCRESGTAKFKAVSALLKETMPGDG